MLAIEFALDVGQDLFAQGIAADIHIRSTYNI